MVGQVGVLVREGVVKGGQGKTVKVVDVVNKKVDVERVRWDAEVHVGERDQPVVRTLVRMYRSNGNDVQWARSGVLAKVINGEAITVVQNRVEDAGFVDLDIIPLGADKFFIPSTSEKETLSSLEDAKDFLGVKILFIGIKKWFLSEGERG